MGESLIQVRHLKKYFHTPAGLLHAVDDLSFDIQKGSTLGVVGEIHSGTYPALPGSSHRRGNLV